MDVKAGGAYVELFLKDSPLVDGLRASQGKLQAWGDAISSVGRRVAAVGASIVGALGADIMVGTLQKVVRWLQAAATDASKSGANFATMANQTGLSVEALTALDFAAGQTGTTLEAVTGALAAVNDRAIQAARGNQEAGAAFRALGLNAAALAAMNPETQLLSIANALAAVPAPAMRAALATDLLGSNAANLLPLLSQGAAGIRRFAAEAANRGLIIPAAEAQAAKEFDNATKTLTKSIARLGQTISAAILPYMTRFVTRVTAWIKTALDWAAQNQALILSIFKIGLAIATAGAALILLGNVFAAIAGAVGGFIAIVVTVGTIIGTVAAGLAAIISLPGLIAVGIVALAASFFNWRTAAGSTIDWIKGAFYQLRDEATAAWGAIGNAMMGGDLAAAAQVVWSLLKLEWAKGIGWINQKWAVVAKFFMDTWDDVVSWFGELWVDPIGTMERTWIKAVAAMKTAWNNLDQAIATTMRSTSTSIAGWMVGLLEKSGAITPETAKEMQEDVLRQGARSQKEESNRHGYDTRNKTIEDQKNKDLAAAEPTDPKTKAALERIRAKHLTDEAGRQADLDASVKDSEDAAAAARAEFARALGEANAVKPIDWKKLNPFAAGGKQPGALDLTGKTHTVGSFSARGVAGLGLSGTTLDRIARASEETAKNTRQKYSDWARANDRPMWGS
jgi:hypothetical protein